MLGQSMRLLIQSSFGRVLAMFHVEEGVASRWVVKALVVLRAIPHRSKGKEVSNSDVNNAMAVSKSE